MNEISLFPTCQVRIVRFYVSLSTPLPFSSLRSSPLRFSFFFFFSPPLTFSSSWSFFSLLLSTASHPCQFYLPDSNRDHLRSVLAAGPEPRASAPSVRCRTSTNRHHLKEDMSERMSERMSEDIYQKERQKDC